MIFKAKRFAQKAHKGQTRWGGEDYFRAHVAIVAENVVGVAQTVVAFLHDVLEDTDVRLVTINQNFGLRIAQAVDAITKREGEDYVDYLKRVASDRLAVDVKIEDLKHNLSTLGDGHEHTRLKYRLALLFLESL